jgi:hypothetical protein
MGHPQVQLWFGVGAEKQEGGVKPPLHAEQTQIEVLGEAEGIADAEEFVGFGGGDAGVGG